MTNWWKSGPIWAGVVSVVVVLGVSGAVVRFSRHADEFWPVAVPGLLTGAGTLALAVSTFAVLRSDQRDRKDRDRREHRAQAARVYLSMPEVHGAAWQDNQESTADGGPEQLRFTYQASIVNRSDFPIVAVEAVIVLTEEQTAISVNKLRRRVTFYPEIAPGADPSTVETDTYWLSTETTPADIKRAGTPTVTLTFTDQDGSTWRRSNGNRLDEIPTDRTHPGGDK